MQLYPGADLIQCEIGGRPLYLPVLREENEALLLDCARAPTPKPIFRGNFAIWA